MFYILNQIKMKPIPDWWEKEWKPVKGFEGYYDINEDGQIRTYWKIGQKENSLSEIPLRYLNISKSRRKKWANPLARVHLYNWLIKKGFKLSRLVASHFMGLTDEMAKDRSVEVIHLNWNMMDCRKENLKITTSSERALNYHKNKKKW